MHRTPCALSLQPFKFVYYLPIRFDRSLFGPLCSFLGRGVSAGFRCTVHPKEAMMEGQVRCMGVCDSDRFVQRHLAGCQGPYYLRGKIMHVECRQNHRNDNCICGSLASSGPGPCEEWMNGCDNKRTKSWPIATELLLSYYNSYAFGKREILISIPGVACGWAKSDEEKRQKTLDWGFPARQSGSLPTLYPYSP